LRHGGKLNHPPRASVDLRVGEGSAGERRERQRGAVGDLRKLLCLLLLRLVGLVVVLALHGDLWRLTEELGRDEVDDRRDVVGVLGPVAAFEAQRAGLRTAAGQPVGLQRVPGLAALVQGVEPL
jgi:hypothetical protein